MFKIVQKSFLFCMFVYLHLCLCFVGHRCAEECVLQFRRRPRNIDVILHVALFKGSNCGVVDAVIAISFCMCAVVADG